MYWPDTQTGVDVEPARKPVASPVRKFFTEGGLGQPPTVPGGDWFNQITNEILNVLAAAGIDPSKTDDDQLLQAIQTIIYDGFNLSGFLTPTASNDAVPAYEDGGIESNINAQAQALLNRIQWILNMPFGRNDEGVIYRPGTNYESAGTVAKPETRPWYHDFRPLGVAQGGDAIFSTDGANMFMGPGAGNFTMRPVAVGDLPPGIDYNLQCSHNIGYGLQTLGSVTIGYKNSGYATNSLRKLTSGHGNDASGRDSAHELTTGIDGVYTGFTAGFGVKTGNYHSVHGASALYNNENGDGIVAHGRRAGFDHLTGSYDIFVGEQSAYGYLHGSYSTFIGKQLGPTGLTQGDSNLVIGSRLSGLQDEKEQVVIADGNGKITLEVHKDPAAVVKKASKLDLPSYNVTPFDATATDGQVDAGSTLLLRSFGNAGNAIAQIVFQSRVGQPFSRIVSTGAGTGQMVFINDNVERLRILSAGGIVPGLDNTQNLGSASKRLSEVFAGTGTINTSDGRDKSAPLAIDDAVLDAWADVQLITFQWLESIRLKGEETARWHFGVIAQQVRDSFAARGLDGTDYGLLCYDEWDERYVRVQTNEGEIVTKTRTVKRPSMVTSSHEVLVSRELEDGTIIKIAQREEYQELKRVQVYVFNEDGSPRLNEDGTKAFVFDTVMEEVTEEYTEPAEPEYIDVLEQAAGNRWGIRADQCLFLEAAFQRRNYAHLQNSYQSLADRITQLENSGPV